MGVKDLKDFKDFKDLKDNIKIGERKNAFTYFIYISPPLIRGEEGRGCLFFCLLDLATENQVGYRRSNEDGRQRTEDDTQNHCPCEAADAVTTEDEDREQHDEG